MLILRSLQKNQIISIVRLGIFNLFLFCFFNSHAQDHKEANIWAFGNYQLDFNSGSAVVKMEFASHLNRGMGVISDENGSLLFYTDGYTVFNKDHQVMPNGTGLMPSDQSSSTQESIIIRKPGAEDIYFIISVDPSNGQASSGLYYATVDLSLSAGLGSVTTKGTRLIQNTSNNLSAALHTNQKDIWVVTHGHNSNTYYVLLITEDGISTEIKQQNIGNTHGYWDGQLKFSPDSKKVAVSYSSPSPGVSLFDFDGETGVLSNAMNFSFYDIESSPVIAGLEFSSDGTKLFTYEARYDHVFQFDVSLSTEAEILSSRQMLAQSILHNSLRQFQLAPDGKIYITKGGGGGGTAHLGVIENPNASAEKVIIHENGLFLEGGDSFVNYTPNFIQNYFYKTNFVFDQRCEQTPINFRITNQSRIDSVKWSFGEGSSSELMAPQFRYSSPGVYTVTLLAHYPERTDTITHEITIDPMPSLVMDESKTLCYGSEFLAQDGFVSYRWNTGDTLPSVKIKDEGWYKLSVKNEFSCVSIDSVLITVVDLPSISLPDTIELGDLQAIQLNPGTFHSVSWSTGETTPSISVSNHGWYSVMAKNSFGCESAKSVFVAADLPPSNAQANEWQLLNPEPSHYAGLDCYFINKETGFIVNGPQLLGTKDGGTTWEIIMSLSSGKRISFKDSFGYIVGDNGAIYKSTHLGGGWNKVNVDFTDNLNALTIIHPDTVFVTSDTKLFVTHDGGTSWKGYPIPGIDVEDSYFTSSSVGHVAGINGTIRKTIDGGATWYTTASSSLIPSNFFRIVFVNADVGYATQEHSEVYKTTDGGETWTKLHSSLDAGYALQFIDENTGFLAGEDGAMHKTTDGGATWKWVGFDGRKYLNDIYSVFFVDQFTGFATGLKGRIIKTQDGGSTWKEYGLSYDMIGQLMFTSENVAYARAGNELIKTTNKGKDWKKIGSPLAGQYTRQFDFINDQTGFVVAGGGIGTSGNSGQVYKTTDGGLTWNKTHASFELFLDNIHCIDFVDEMLGFVSGGYNGGAVLKTADGGVTWRAVASNAFGQIQFLNSQVGYAKNIYNYYDRIYKTIDGGESWEVIWESDTDIAAFDFVNESTGYFIGNYGTSYKTVDGGITWQELTAPYEFYKDVKFFSPDFGYILDEGGALFRTRDGGSNWERIHRTYGLQSIEIHNQDIYVAGDRGIILTSQISYNDLIDGRLSVISLTDSTASIDASVKSHIVLLNATVQIMIGRQTNEYDEVFELGSVGGYVSIVIDHQFKGLEPSTEYYCRLKVVDGDKIVMSPELFFITPSKEVVTAIDRETLQPEISVFPNPAKVFIRVKSSHEAAVGGYEVFDMAGNKLATGELSGEIVLNTSTFGRGSYILRVHLKGKVFTTRMIIE